MLAAQVAGHVPLVELRLAVHAHDAPDGVEVGEGARAAEGSQRLLQDAGSSPEPGVVWSHTMRSASARMPVTS
jgi:hypothetical protein